MSFRDNLLKYNHICFGKDSSFLVAMSCVYLKKKAKGKSGEPVTIVLVETSLIRFLKNKSAFKGQ